MLVAGDIIKKCSITLKDPDNVRWLQDELLGYLDEAQREISRVPGAYTKIVLHELSEGTKQQLPAEAVKLLSVLRNWNDDDEPCDPVVITTRSLLDAFDPDWHTCPRRQFVDNYIYDDRSPDVFFVYPPNDGTGRVELMYAANPEKLSSVNDVLVLHDEFETPLVMYVLYRAYNKDSDYSAGLQMATSFYTAYTSSLQSAMQSAGTTTPNAALVAGAVKPNGGTE